MASQAASTSLSRNAENRINAICCVTPSTSWKRFADILHKSSRAARTLTKASPIVAPPAERGSRPQFSFVASRLKPAPVRREFRWVADCGRFRARQTRRFWCRAGNEGSVRAIGGRRSPLDRQDRRRAEHQPLEPRVSVGRPSSSYSRPEPNSTTAGFRPAANDDFLVVRSRKMAMASLSPTTARSAPKASDPAPPLSAQRDIDLIHGGDHRALRRTREPERRTFLGPLSNREWNRP